MELCQEHINLLHKLLVKITHNPEYDLKLEDWEVEELDDLLESLRCYLVS